MKVLVATGLYPPESGGPATYSKLLYDHLPDYGIDVVVVPFRSVRRHPKLVRHIAYFLKLLKAARSVDCIYAQDPVSVGLPAFFVAKLLRKPFVLKVVGDYAWEQGVQRFGVADLLDDFLEKRSYSPPVRFLKSIQSFVAKKADCVVTPSEYLSDVVQAWGVPRKKVKVIYNSFDVPKETGNKKTLRGLLNFDGHIILTAGRLVSWKGFEELIELMPDLAREFPGIRLIIAGEGPQREELEKKIRSLSLEKNVVMTGTLSRDVLHGYIGASDVFVLYSGYEGLSHMLLEVMAVGIPIVATNIGGNPELIENGRSGTLVPYGDTKLLKEAIVFSLTHQKETSNYVKHASEKLAVFTQEKMLTQTARLLKSVCTSS